MVAWKNLDTVSAYQELQKAAPVNLAEVMAGEKGADRVKNYSVPMAAGLTYNYAAKQVDDKVLEALVKLAEETQLAEKFEAVYNGEVINTGEKRMVLHHMTRGQLGDAVWISAAFMWSSRKRLRNWPIRFTAARLPMRQARSLLPLYRSESAAVTWAPAQCIWRWRTGPR